MHAYTYTPTFVVKTGKLDTELKPERIPGGPTMQNLLI